MRDVADLGFEYLVLLAIAKGGKAFYDTPLLPRLPMACADPIEALLKGGAKYGVKFFLSSDWFGDWDEQALLAPGRMSTRYRMMEEIATRYARHKSFYGCYWPNEACLTPYFSDNFIRHVNLCSAAERRLMPKARTLTAPYGTNRAVADDKFVRQLEQLDVDIIAYQDEVGVRKSRVDETPAFYEGLKKAHQRVPRVAIWADVEIFFPLRVVPFAISKRRGLGGLPLRATFSPPPDAPGRIHSQVSTAFDVILRSILRARRASKGDRPGHASLPPPCS